MKPIARIPGAIFGLALALSFAWFSAECLKPRASPPEPSPLDPEIERLGVRFHFRQVLRGQAVPGNAADSYRRAALAIYSGGQGLLEALERGDEPDLEEHEVWIHVNREASDQMSFGAAKAGSSLLLDFTKGYEASSLEVGRSPEVTSVSIARAIALKKKGDEAEAVRLFLDTARYGQDLARGGGLVHRLFASRVEFLALCCLARALGEGFHSPGTLRSLLREAGVLAVGAHPVLETIRAEAALALGEIRESGGAEAGSRAESILSFVAEVEGEASEGDGPVSLSRIAHIAAGYSSRDMAQIREYIDLALTTSGRVECLRSALMVLAASRIVQVVEGELPESLSEIESVFGGPAPSDPFSGSPFRYHRRSATRAVLSSNGPDGDADHELVAPFNLVDVSDGDWEWILEEAG